MGEVVNLDRETQEREECLLYYAQHLLGLKLEPWQVDLLRQAARTRKPVVAHQIDGATCEIIQLEDHAV